MKKKRTRVRTFGMFSTPGPTLLLRVSRTTMPEAVIQSKRWNGLYAIEHIFTPEEAAGREAARQELAARWELAA